MNKYDAAVIKALSELPGAKLPTLSPEEEEMLAIALDPEKQFLQSVEKLFKEDK